MSFFTEISQVLFDFQNKNGKALDPSRVTNSIIRAAQKEARSWGNDSKPEIPNMFTVAVGTEDWNAYYGQRPEDIALEVAYYVMRRAHAKGLYLASDPVVSFLEDASIPKGRCRVNAQFNFDERERLRREPLEIDTEAEVEPNPEPMSEAAGEESPAPEPVQQATVVMQPVETAPAAAPVASQPAVSAPMTKPEPIQQPTIAMQPMETASAPTPIASALGAAATSVINLPGETMVFKKPVTPEAPAADSPAAMTSIIRPVTPEARLEGSGLSLRITPDCTVGVVRKPQAEIQPDVALPYGQFPYGSHIQGKFTYADGIWSFLNVGRNGTRVQMHDQDIMLEPNMSCVIPYNSWITFAEGVPLRFVKTS